MFNKTKVANVLLGASIIGVVKTVEAGAKAVEVGVKGASIAGQAIGKGIARAEQVGAKYREQNSKTVTVEHRVIVEHVVVEHHVYKEEPIYSRPRLVSGK